MISKEDFEEIINELKNLNESIFGFGGSGRIEDAIKIILGDNGMLYFFDEIAKRKLREEGEFPIDGDYPASERVERLLINNGRLCDFIYNLGGGRKTYDDFRKGNF